MTATGLEDDYRGERGKSQRDFKPTMKVKPVGAQRIKLILLARWMIMTGVCGCRHAGEYEQGGADDGGERVGFHRG